MRNTPRTDCWAQQILNEFGPSNCGRFAAMADRARQLEVELNKTNMQLAVASSGLRQLTDTLMVNKAAHAEAAYTAYCLSVGGRAFNGDPLPDWKTFSTDPNKSVQAKAWIDAATAVIQSCLCVAVNKS